MDNQKKRFSSLQSNHYKMVNNINMYGLNKDRFMHLEKINQLIELLESEIVSFTENENNVSPEEYNEIVKQNNIINTLIPHALKLYLT